MVEYIKKTDFKATKKDKAIAIGAICFALFLGYKFLYVDKTPEGYQNISPELSSYLKTSKYYGKIFESGKKVVIYHPIGSEIDYPREFSNTLSLVMKNPEYQEKYAFVPFESVTSSALMDIKEGEKIVKYTAELKKDCRTFCVVNLPKNQLYFYFAPDKELGEKLPQILNRLQFWGLKMDKL